MRARVTVKVTGLAEMLAETQKLGDRVLKQMARRMTIATVIAQREVMNNVRRRFVQRTGGLRKSFQIRIITRRAGGPTQLAGGSVTGIVGSDHPGANLLDEGGVVSAKRKAAMPVPLSEEAKQKKAAGMPDNLVTIPPGFLIEHIGEGEDIFHFVLAKSVSVQGTNYFGEAIQRAESKIVDELGEGLRVAIQGRGRR
jgi:hypothetical protein